MGEHFCPSLISLPTNVAISGPSRVSTFTLDVLEILLHKGNRIGWISHPHLLGRRVLFCVEWL